MKKKIITLFIFSFTVGFAQNITVNESFTPQQLIENILVNSGCVSVTNFSASGGNFGTGELSYGYFNANGSAFPFQEGILLSTGKLNSAIGPNSNFSDDTNGSGWAGDPDLNSALGLSNTFNASVLEFDFIPNANTISFEYIFSSEQYLLNPSSGQCNFTDGFAFLLKEASASTYQNLALIPGTTTPVRVNTVRGSGTNCPSANEAYFDAFNTGNYPTAFDGQTKILTAQSAVTPGVTYHIKLVIADEGNGRFDSGIFLRAGSFISEKDLGPDRLIATGNPLCDTEVLTLNATQVGATNYQWFQNGNLLVGENNPTYDVSAAGTYSVQIDINTSCTLTGEIEIEEAPILTIATSNFEICDTNTDGFAMFDLASIKSQIFTSLPANFTVDLFDSTTAATALASNYTNTDDFQQIIYARITNIANCYGNIPITLNVNIFPEVFTDETIGICNNTPTNISAPNGYTYSWNTNPIQTTQAITVAAAGTYTVTCTNTDNCSKTKTFTVVNSEIATITNIEVNDFNEELTATISVTGNGDYEYALDGINYQNSPIFNLTDAGEYTIYVNDKNNCGVTFQSFYALSYPKYFTPNNDGYNDTWLIKNLNQKGLENSKIYIFDRFGKLLKQISANGTGWNGTYNGHPLSSSDYWFVLEAANGKTVKGHFSLKR